jgi:hypothetical protein
MTTKFTWHTFRSLHFILPLLFSLFVEPLTRHQAAATLQEMVTQLKRELSDAVMEKSELQNTVSLNDDQVSLAPRFFDLLDLLSS